MGELSGVQCPSLRTPRSTPGGHLLRQARRQLTQTECMQGATFLIASSSGESSYHSRSRRGGRALQTLRPRSHFNKEEIYSPLVTLLTLSYLHLYPLIHLFKTLLLTMCLTAVRKTDRSGFKSQEGSATPWGTPSSHQKTHR